MEIGEVDPNIAEPGRDAHTNIIGSLWVSSWLGAKNFTLGKRICVHHDSALVLDYHMPILLTRPDETDRNKGAKANLKQLEMLGHIIGSCLDCEEPLMIHCKGGIERSPLTVAYFLVKFRHYKMDDAYEFIKKARPVVEDRRTWLPSESINGP